MKKTTTKTKVFELGAEDGSLSIYKFIDKDNKDWYFHNVNDMGFEDEDIPPTNRDSVFSKSYAEAFIKMLAEYPYVLSLYPLFVHPDVVNVTMLFFKVNSKSIEYIDYHIWAEVLKVKVEELK